MAVTLLAALAVAGGAAHALPSAPPGREIRLVMGTVAEVRAGGSADPSAALDAAFAALSAVDRQMSLWRESDLVRLNRSRDAIVPPELLAVLEAALEVSRASGGAFDPTVEPLVRATGGLGGPARALSPVERAALLARVGAARVHVDAVARRVRLDPGTALDLGGIAKGYAADLALAALRRAGAAKGLVDLGGSSLGAFGAPLEVLARDPERGEAAPWAAFRIEGGFVGTSGGEEKPGHILDPRTGLPANGVAAVSVIAASGMEADALSTAAYVLGPEAGLALLERRGAAGLFLTRSGGDRLVRTTRGFARRYALRLRPGVASLEGEAAAGWSRDLPPHRLRGPGR